MTPTTIRALTLVDVGRFEVRELEKPRPGSREVLVETEAVGLCGTDFHIHSGFANYNLDASGRPIPLSESPQILGHEIVGRVVEVGKGVDDLAEGDSVLVDQGLQCMSAAREPLCEYCFTGNSHQCEQYREHGITGVPGGFAGLLAVPAVNCIKRSADHSAVLAALSEPLGCVLHSMERACSISSRYRLEDSEPDGAVRTAVVLGAGPAGLLFLQHLRKVSGFEGPILVSDPNPAKRELADAFGGEAVAPEELEAAVLERSEGRLAEFLVEASGSGLVYAQIPSLIRKQATVVAYGIGHRDAGLTLLSQLQWKEAFLGLSVGASGGFDPDGRPSIYRRSLNLIEDGIIEADAILTHQFRGLEGLQRAFEGGNKEPGYVKGVWLAEE